MKNKHIAAAFAILLGIIGGHKFYLGKWFQGILYILLGAVTFGVVPCILGILEGVLYLVNSQEWFDLRYNILYIENKIKLQDWKVKNNIS